MQTIVVSFNVGRLRHFVLGGDLCCCRCFAALLTASACLDHRDGLVAALKEMLPMLPDEQTQILTSKYGLTLKDAKTLISLDGGTRLDYFHDVFNALPQKLAGARGFEETGRLVGNW